MEISNLITLSFYLVIASGCATISKEECQTGDWNGIGYRDGMRGKSLSRAQSYAEECAKIGASVDRQSYEKGRQEGLKIYCTKENGFALGKAGSSMFTECPPDLQPNFFKAYNTGKKVNELQKKLAMIDSDIQEIEKKMDLPNVTPNEKALYRSRLHDLRRNRDDVKSDLTRAEVDIEREAIYSPQI